MIVADRGFVLAQAKINLCLHVGAKRSDGYHDLESLVAFTAFADGVGLADDDVLSLTVIGPRSADLPVSENNLVLRAARLLAEERGVKAGARMTLHKHIPVASGMGGGSADAAAALRGLARLWNLDLYGQDLQEIAVKLGADVPVCVESSPAWMEGRGERITRLPPLPQFWLLLVNPRIPVSTAEVFAKLEARRGLRLACPLAPFDDVRSLVYFLQSTTNDLEAPARSLAPVIGDVLSELSRLPGALLTRMSGSGATCFALFDSERELRPAEAMLAERRSDWWIAGTPVPEHPTGTPVFVQ